MSGIYRPDETLEKETYDKEYVKHVEARKRRAQIRRAQQAKKNRIFCLVAGAIVLLLIIILIFSVSCSDGGKGSETQTTAPEVTTVPEPTTEEETTMVAMYTTDVLNLRAQPNTNSEIIVQIGAGKKVELISEEGKWCKVKRGKDKGYVMKKYLSYTNTLN